MKKNPLPLLQRMKVWQLWLFSVTFSVLLTEAVVSAMGLLLKGEIPTDYLLTGLVASCFVASLIVTLLSYFIEKLSESQRQLHAIIEAEPECVKLLAADGTLLQMNRAGLNMIEADSMNQTVGLTLPELILPEYRNAFIALTKRVFAGESGNLKFELCGLKESHRWLDTHAVPLRDSHGHITALLAVTRDITERKQAEAALRESEDALRHLFEDSKDPILLLKEGRFIDCNAAALAQLGYQSKSELLNCSPGEISPAYQPDGRHSEEKASEMIDTSVRLGYHRFEWLHQRADGSPLPAEVSLTPMTVQGKLIVHACWRDITERKAIENKLHSRTDELALQNQILQLINQGVDLPTILNELARQVETLHPKMLCSILLLDEGGKHLRHGAAPSLPDFYNQAVDGLAIGDSAGSCGTAAYLGEQVIVEDIQQHPYWKGFHDLAKRADLQACWSHPIKNSQGHVLGTFAIYHRLPTHPTATEISLVGHYADLAQLAIERNQSMVQIAESLSILKATLESTGEAILAVDLDNNWLLHNQKFIDLWQIPSESIAVEIGAESLPHKSDHIENQLKDADAFSRKVDELYASPEAHSFDTIEFKDGKIVERYSTPQIINNKVVGRVWSFRDVTVQKLAEAELRIAATAFDSQEGMSISDADQVILKINKAFTHITGYSPEEIIGQTHALLNSGRQDAHFYEGLQHSLKQHGYWEGEIWNRRKNGEIYPEWLSITTVRDAE